MFWVIQSPHNRHIELLSSGTGRFNSGVDLNIVGAFSWFPNMKLASATALLRSLYTRSTLARNNGTSRVTFHRNACASSLGRHTLGRCRVGKAATNLSNTGTES